MEGKCLFKFRYGSECNDSQPGQTNKGRARIDSIIKASKIYLDDLHVELEQNLRDNEQLTIHYHKNCVSRYTSSSNTSRYAKELPVSKPPAKKLRRSNSSFDFLSQCLYCGKKCEISKDTKHPDRWRPAYICRSTVSEHDRTPYNQYVLHKCSEREDGWAEEVRSRVLCSLSDLHASDARYHKDCMSRFFSNRMNPAGQADATQASYHEYQPDMALKHMITTLSNDKKRIWNSVELHQEYQDHGGVDLTRSQLTEELCSNFSGDLLIISSPGYANVVAFQSQASIVLKMVKHEEDGIENSIRHIAKRVVKECKAIPLDTSKYRLNIDEQLAQESISPTVQNLLASISSKLDNTPPALLIGNIITSALRHKSTDLQIALGILLRDSKTILGYTYDYGITCSYDEILRFKKSAAMIASKEPSVHGISSAEVGLVQTVVDNFDADIHSPNGKLSTHSLAMILTQPTGDHGDDTNTIERLNHVDFKLPIADDEDEHVYYAGQKNPPLPEMPEPRLPDAIQTHQRISNARAIELDFQFMKDMTATSDCPEYHGYNTKVCREQGHMLKKKTNIVYLPLIDKAPADPATIMSAMLKARAVTEATGQEYVVFTADQQLYRVAAHVMWENQALFGNIYLRLGGMHLLMSYVGCIGYLMAGSGIVEVLSEAFGGVLKMLTGKKYPNNVRALRMLVEELIRPLFQTRNMICMAELQQALDDTASHSRTAKMWVNCLIKPVFTIMKYVRAEREADWPLHLAAVNEMMPLFFAASHFNYARYGLYYLRDMIAMPEDVRQHFMNGEHTMHHNPGVFNGIWSDMGIETTYMRYGHGQSGIIGITLRPETLKIWAYSLHACNTVVSHLDLMRTQKQHRPKSQTHHKEETKARVKCDSKDRKVLRDKLELCIDPLHSEENKEGLVNIVTGQVFTHPTLNVDNAIELGRKMMEEFQGMWPASFHKTLHKCVTTMAQVKKNSKVNSMKILDTEMIYARAMALQCSQRNYNTQDLMSHELASRPASMFDESGAMRVAKTKSVLKNNLKVEVPRRHTQIDASFLDGCAVLWVVPWPTGGIVQEFLNNFRCHIQSHMDSGDVYLVFDRYMEGSIKESTRNERDQGASRVYTLRPATRLPSQKVILTVSRNKKQLIDLISEDLISHKDVFNNKLVITGNDPVPVQIEQGVVSRREDMAIMHEEADTMLIQQVASVGVANALVVADDTDVFVLLCHFVFNRDITGHVMMTSPIRGRTVIDINASVDKNRTIMDDLLAAHGLTGCDTVAMYHGIGKGVTLKVLRTGKLSLSKVGDITVSVEEALVQATHFILSCYGRPECTSLTDARQKIWSRKVSQSIGAAPKLQSLPPTNEAFAENVARAHLQVAKWKHAIHLNPPNIDPLTHGWTRCDGSISLAPTTVPDHVSLAPDDILKMIKCSCDSATPCKSKRCGCHNANMTCTSFCACQGGDGCFNQKTRELIQAEDETDHENNDDSDDETDID